MNASYDKSTALVVLPSVSGGRLQDSSLRAWLAQSDLSRATAPQELLHRVLDELKLPYPEQGLAAMRMWGQTGERPANWIAAADPVYLEPRLDHLCLHALRQSSVTPREMRLLIDYLQGTLASDTQEANQFGFVRLGPYCYLSAKHPIATAAMPAYVIDQQVPNDYLPGGDAATMHRQLLGEIEMALHEHAVNVQRQDAGQQPVNSLWLWGGGTAPQQQTQPRPPLFSDDALLAGYWYSATGVAEVWPGSIALCLEDSVAGFVAEVPEATEASDAADVLQNCLTELREALRSGRLSKVTLLFRDGLRADVERSHALRFWRRDAALLQS